MEELDIQQRWKNGQISFWATIQHYINERDINGTIETLRRLEVDFIADRSKYNNTYWRLYDMAYSHGFPELIAVLKNRRGLDISYLLEPTDVYWNYSVGNYSTINRFIVESALRKNIYVKEIFDDRGNIDVFQTKLSQANDDVKSIICYAVGYSGSDYLIEHIGEYSPEYILLGRAEAGDERIIKYFVKGGTPDSLLIMEIYKRLIIYQHEELFLKLHNHIVNIYVPEDERREQLLVEETTIGPTLFTNGTNAILSYGSNNLISKVINEGIDTSNIETYTFYKYHYKSKDYTELVKNMKTIREELPVNLFDLMMEMPESMRYKVYNYTMDERVFTSSDYYSNQLTILSKDDAVKKAYLVYKLQFYSETYVLHPFIRDLITNLGLGREDLLRVLPSNPAVENYRESRLWLYILLIVILVLLSIASYRYYKRRKSLQLTRAR